MIFDSALTAETEYAGQFQTACKYNIENILCKNSVFSIHCKINGSAERDLFIEKSDGMPAWNGK